MGCGPGLGLGRLGLHQEGQGAGFPEGGGDALCLACWRQPWMPGPGSWVWAPLKAQCWAVVLCLLGPREGAELEARWDPVFLQGPSLGLLPGLAGAPGW